MILPLRDFICLSLIYHKIEQIASDCGKLFYRSDRAESHYPFCDKLEAVDVMSRIASGVKNCFAM